MPQGPWQRVGTVERVAATGLEIYQVRLENLPVRLTPPCWTQWAWRPIVLIHAVLSGLMKLAS